MNNYENIFDVNIDCSSYLDFIEEVVLIISSDADDVGGIRSSELP